MSSHSEWRFRLWPFRARLVVRTLDLDDAAAGSETEALPAAPDPRAVGTIRYVDETPGDGEPTPG